MVNSQFTKTVSVINELQAIIDRYREKLAERGYDTRNLYRTLSCDVRTEDKIWHVEIHLEDYLYYVENGREPGKMPPVETIQKWIEFKQILPKPITLKSGKTVTPTVQSLAFLIARSIGMEGTTGTGIFHQSFEETRDQFIESIKNAVYEDLKDIMKTTYIK